MALTAAEARERLETLVKIPGELKLIRPWLKPEYRANADDLRSAAPEIPEPGSKASAAEREEYDAARRAQLVMLRDPSSYLQVPIVRIEDAPAQKGDVRAFADDGSYVQGDPVAVLARVREWEQGS